MKKSLFIITVFGIALIAAQSLLAQEIFDVVRSGDLAKVKELVEKDPQVVKARNSNQSTPLHVAVDVSNFEIAKYLIEKGADVNSTNKTVQTPLFYAKKREIAKILIEKGADINACNNQNISVIRRAVSSGVKELAEILRENGAKFPSIKDETGVIFLGDIVRCGSVKLFEEMLLEGADIFGKDSTGLNLFHYATLGRQYEMIRRLIESGMKLNDSDNAGWTPLHYAVMINSKETVSLLLENNAPINACTRDGFSAYNLAVELNYKDIISVLESKGAEKKDPEILRPTGEYFGLKKPGIIPEIFAPNIIIQGNLRMFAPAFSADGREVYYSYSGGLANNHLFISRLEKDGWTIPKLTNFEGMEPFITIDNKKMLWCGPEKRSGSLGLSMAERTVNGWSESKYIGEGMLHLTVSREGEAYVSTPEGIRDVKFSVDGLISGLEPMLDENNEQFKIDRSHPSIAPDGSYILYDSYATNLFVRFREQSGNWGKEIDLTEHGISKTAGISSISPDGKYIFFFDYGNRMTYWVSSELVTSLKNKN